MGVFVILLILDIRSKCGIFARVISSRKASLDRNSEKEKLMTMLSSEFLEFDEIRFVSYDLTNKSNKEIYKTSIVKQ